jgi:hypothetical protein
MATETEETKTKTDDASSTDTETEAKGNDNTEGDKEQESAKSDEGGEGEEEEEGETLLGKKAKAEDEEKIVYDLRLPKETQLQESTLDETEQFAKEHKLNQEVAQKLVDVQSKAVDGYVAQVQQQWVDITEGWSADIAKNKEVGGRKLKENQTLANRLLEKYAPEGFMEDLGSSGYGNHSGLFVTLVRIAKDVLGEDKIPKDSAKAQPRPDLNAMDDASLGKVWYKEGK